MIALVAGLAFGVYSQNASPQRGGAAGIAPPKSVPGSRIRIVPQASGGLLQDLEESKDGTRLVTHDREFAPRLWDAKRQILLTVLDGHPDSVDNVAFTPDGKFVVTRSKRLVIVWDSLRARRVASLAPPKGDEFSTSASSRVGGTLALGTKAGVVYLGKADTIGIAKKIGAHAKGVGALAFSVDGARLFSGSDDGTGRTWDVATGAAKWSVTGHKKGIAWADFSKTGLLATTEYDRAARGYQANAAKVWSAGGKELATYPHVLGARGVELTWGGATFVGATGDEIVTFAASGTMPIFKVGNPKPLRNLIGHKGAIRELRYSADRKYVSTVASDDELFMWDAVAGRILPFNPGIGTYTAGDFSPNRNVFWLGYAKGEVRQFDIKTGQATKETFGAVAPANEVRMTEDGSTVWLRVPSTGSSIFDIEPSAELFIDPSGSHGSQRYYMSYDWADLSPDGSRLAFRSRVGRMKSGVADIWNGKYEKSYGSDYAIDWSVDGTMIAILEPDEGNLYIESPSVEKTLKGYKLEVDKAWGGLGGPAWHPNGKWVVVTHLPGNLVRMYDWETGAVVRELGKFSDVYAGALFSSDGKKMYLRGLGSIIAIDLETGKHLWSKASPEYKFTNEAILSSDGKRLAVNLGLGDHDVVFDTATGMEIFRAPSDGIMGFSTDGTRLVTSTETEVTLWNVDTKKPLSKLHHAGRVTCATIVMGGTRIATVDSVGGTHLWNLAGKRMATLVAMKDGTWLVYDDEGRYDATDPSNVEGAYFVLEWSGGLEPVAMPQLKGQFYEPHLLAKALGTDKEPLRDVPSLENLRLFPSLTVKETAPMTYAIASSERDEGGVGAVKVAINGKEVLRREGAGYFKVDLSQYTSFLLPEARLPEGGKNTLSVTVSNEKGDLVSPPETVALPTPEGLKVPDVRLFALCAGIGDYVGSKGDLVAPPSDALAIAAALRETAGRLLPGRVTVDTMTTRDGIRPTRANILGWLRETAVKATSSDIVFIFVAGHGMSKIGEQSGYFLLTSEADPGDVGPSAAGTVAISGEDLRAALAAIPAGKQVVVLDTCHSGAATKSIIAADRSVSGEYQRAWESIKDTTGTWLLAGSAADQVSYESANVDHGMLTYALLEAIDKASAEGLRKAPSGELFVDVERWLVYAENRVESLKSEVGIAGVQRPSFKRSTHGGSFDLGVMDEKRKGFLDLKAPSPIVIVGDFQKDEEDPLGLEDALSGAMRESKAVKPWFDIAKHPGVYRMTGTYTLEGEAVKVRTILQIFDERQQRRTLETFEVVGPKNDLPALAAKVRTEVESRIRTLEDAKKKP